jgi:hypothetical protein
VRSSHVPGGSSKVRVCWAPAPRRSFSGSAQLCARLGRGVCGVNITIAREVVGVCARALAARAPLRRCCALVGRGAWGVGRGAWGKHLPGGKSAVTASPPASHAAAPSPKLRCRRRPACEPAARAASKASVRARACDTTSARRSALLLAIRRPRAFAGTCVHRRLLDACQAALRAQRRGVCAPPRNVRAELAAVRRLCGRSLAPRSWCVLAVVVALNGLLPYFWRVLCVSVTLTRKAVRPGSRQTASTRLKHERRGHPQCGDGDQGGERET